MSDKFTLKNGSVILVAGYTNEGKSSVVQRLISSAKFKNKIAFDDNREYYSEEKKTDWSVFYDYDTFKKSMTAKDETTNEYVGAEQCAVIFDEASKYISASKDEDMAKMYVACEHKFIAMFCLFTSLADIPNSLIKNSHYLILFNTIDTEESLSGLRKVFVPLLALKREPHRPIYVNVRQLVGSEQAKSI